MNLSPELELDAPAGSAPEPLVAVVLPKQPGIKGTVKTLPKAKILVVNDRLEQTVALETILEPLQENVVTAASGGEALRCLLHEEFAVVLLDVHMPDMDGFETAELIRHRKRSRHTPIIFVTAYGQDDSQVTRSYSLGAVDFIQTPIIPEILRAKVKVFVDLYQKSEELRLFTEAEHQRQMSEAREKLEIETKRNLFFMLSVDLLAVAGFGGFLQQTNPAWERALGYTTEELKAWPFHAFACPEEQEFVLAQWKKLLTGAPVTYFENRFRCKHGLWKWLGWTAAPSMNNRLIYLFARDITGRKASENEIRALNQRLVAQVSEVSAINRELEAFNYSISHDLRAPLRSMQGFAQMLATEYAAYLPEPAREFTRRIVESSCFMDLLLHDLLEYSRLGQSEIKIGPVELELALDEVLRSIQSQIQDKHARIDVRRPLAKVLAHLCTLKQILANLLTNALKFVKPDQNPQIRIYTQHLNGVVRLWVEDDGIGIDPSQQERIFGLFQRLHRADAFPGTGIGLAIVRKAAQRMGGHVGVDSTLGNGSRFWLDLAAPRENDQGG